MAIERKSGLVQGVGEGKAMVRLATLLRVDKDNDVIEPDFFPSRPGIKVSIQPYHNHQHPSLGHATVWQDTGKGEILSTFEFNDSTAGQEQYKVLKWDFEHGPISEFSWAFRPRPGSTRSGPFEGRTVRFLGPLPDGSHGVELIEAGPVLKGASINSGLLDVRADIGRGHPDYARIQRWAKKAELWGNIEALRLQVEAQQTHDRWVQLYEEIQAYERQ